MTDEERATKIQQVQQLLVLNYADGLRVGRYTVAWCRSQAGVEFRRERELLLEQLEKLGGPMPKEAEAAPPAPEQKDGGGDGREKARV